VQAKFVGEMRISADIAIDMAILVANIAQPSH
jgi:hypothetical protein